MRTTACVRAAASATATASSPAPASPTASASAAAATARPQGSRRVSPRRDRTPGNRSGVLRPRAQCGIRDVYDCARPLPNGFGARVRVTARLRTLRRARSRCTRPRFRLVHSRSARRVTRRLRAQVPGGHSDFSPRSIKPRRLRLRISECSRCLDFDVEKRSNTLI